MNRILIILLMVVTGIIAQTEETFDEYLQKLITEFKIEQIQADSANLSNAVLLDIREKKEFEVSRLKDAIWIGYSDFEISKINSIAPEQEIIVYCSVGYRSSKIGMELTDSGFKNVKNLYGGIFKWANEGRPIYNDSTQTIEIHAYDRIWGRFITNPDLIKVY